MASEKNQGCCDRMDGMSSEVVDNFWAGRAAVPGAVRRLKAEQCPVGSNVVDGLRRRCLL